MKNARSTILGILMILSAIAKAGNAYFDNDPATTVDLDGTFVAVGAGVGMILMREQKQHEEEKTKPIGQ